MTEKSSKNRKRKDRTTDRTHLELEAIQVTSKVDLSFSLLHLMTLHYFYRTPSHVLISMRTMLVRIGPYLLGGWIFDECSAECSLPGDDVDIRPCLLFF